MRSILTQYLQIETMRHGSLEYGLWASESKIEEMIADYKGRIYEYYEFKEEIINKIRQLYT